MTEDVVFGDNDTLQNVVVYLKGDFSQYSFDAAKSPVILDQKGCTYDPHVLALMTGQQLQVANSDQTTHNVNAVDRVFTRPEMDIPVKCNIHSWMKAYMSVFSNPYFQVTGKDGSFKIENVPPGTYTLTAWHERYGTKEQTVAIQATQEQTATITFTDRDGR
jgi:plastocyanin